jgi:hypothetical protein
MSEQCCSEYPSNAARIFRAKNIMQWKTFGLPGIKTILSNPFSGQTFILSNNVRRRLSQKPVIPRLTRPEKRTLVFRGLRVKPAMTNTVGAIRESPLPTF